MMTFDDLLAMRAGLARLWHELWELDVIEQAEAAVREFSLELLQRQLDGVLEELDACEAHLDRVRQDISLTAIVAAEEQRCAIQRHAGNISRQLTAQRYTGALAQAAQVAARSVVQLRIHWLQRAISRAQTELGQAETLRWPPGL